MSEVTVRDARPGDVPAIRDVFAHYIEHTTATFRTVPETLAEREGWFRAHGPRHPVMVAEQDGAVIGWAALSPWKPTSGYRQTTEFSIYLRPECCGRGLGRRLLAELLERARAAGHHVVIGGACTESEASIRLQEALGFEKVAHLREVGFKFGRWLDVAYYQKTLDAGA